MMQCARPDDADGDERRAGTPRERGREGEGGEADDNGSNHNDGNKSKRQHREGEKGERTKTTTGQSSEGQPRTTTTRYSGLNQNHSDCSETAHSSQKNFPKISTTFSKDDPRQCGADSRSRRKAFFPEERSKAAAETVAKGATRDHCGGLPVVQPRPTIPSGSGETTRRGW